MTDENTTDDTEQPSRDELENRVEQLEQTVQQMLPSRRDALKLGGTALAAGALGSAATGSASAGTNSVGTIGSASNPIDAELEDVNPGSVRAVEFNNNEITGVSSLSTEQFFADVVSIGQIVGELTYDDGGSDQSIPSGTNEKMEWDSVKSENLDIVSVDAANNEITIQEDGRYSIWAHSRWRDDGGWSTGDTAHMRVYVNESRQWFTGGVKSAGTASEPFDIYYEDNYSAEDVVAIRTFQDSGASKDVSKGSGAASQFGRFIVRRIG